MGQPEAPEAQTAADAAAADHARIDRFVAHLQAERRLSSHTAAAYRRDLQALLRDAGGLALPAMTPAVVRRTLARQHAGGLGGRSLARRLAETHDAATLTAAMPALRRRLSGHTRRGAAACSAGCANGARSTPTRAPASARPRRPSACQRRSRPT